MSKFRKVLSIALSAAMVMTSLVVAPMTASAEPETSTVNGVTSTKEDGDVSYRRYEFEGESYNDRAELRILLRNLYTEGKYEHVQENAGLFDSDLRNAHLYVPYDAKNYNMDLWNWKSNDVEFVPVRDATIQPLGSFNTKTGNNYTYFEEDPKYEQYFSLTTDEDGNVVETALPGTAGPAAPGTYRVKMYLRNNTQDNDVIAETMYMDFTILLDYDFERSDDMATVTAISQETDDHVYKEGDVTADVTITAQNLFVTDVKENKKARENDPTVAELRPETIEGLDEVIAETGVNVVCLVTYAPADADGNPSLDWSVRKTDVPETAGKYFAVAEFGIPTPDGNYDYSVIPYIIAPFEIKKQENKEAPVIDAPEDATIADGKIDGVNNTMEYTTNPDCLTDPDKVTWYPVGGASVNDCRVLVPFYFRYKETAELKASPVSEPVTIGAKEVLIDEDLVVGPTAATIYVTADDSKEGTAILFDKGAKKVNEFDNDDYAEGQYTVTLGEGADEITVKVTSEKYDVLRGIQVVGGTGTQADPYTFEIIGEYYEYEITAEDDTLTAERSSEHTEETEEATVQIVPDSAISEPYDPAVSPKHEYEATVTGIDELKELGLEVSGPEIVYYDEDGNKLESAPTMPGTYTAVATITIDGEEYEIETEFTIEKAENEDIDPSYLGVTGPATRWFKTGTITGVKEGMEYSTNGGKTWKPVTGKKISGLGVGDVLIRFAETDEKKAGDAVKATVNLRNKQSTIVPVIVPVPVPTPTPTPVPTPTPTPTPQPTNPWGFWGWLFNPWKR